jgi:hypothetical protein
LCNLPTYGRGIAGSPIALREPGPPEYPQFGGCSRSFGDDRGAGSDDPPMLFCDTASLSLSRSSRVSRITAHSYHGRPPAWTPAQIARPSSKECGREKKLASGARRLGKRSRPLYSPPQGSVMHKASHGRRSSPSRMHRSAERSHGLGDQTRNLDPVPSPNITKSSDKTIASWLR